MIKNLLSIILVLILMFSYKYYKKTGFYNNLDNASSEQIEVKKELDQSPEASIESKKVFQEKATKISHNLAEKFKLKESDIYIGNKDAKLVVIEYFSPTCPHCVTFHERMLPEIKKNFIDNGKILYISREFIGNKQDLDASILARCSKDVDKYYKFIDIILSKQSNWAYSKNYREILTNIGALGGVSAENYAQCLNDEKLIDELKINSTLIHSEPGFKGTPTFIIGGKHFQKSYSVKEITKELNNLLNEK